MAAATLRTGGGGGAPSVTVGGRISAWDTRDCFGEFWLSCVNGPVGGGFVVN